MKKVMNIVLIGFSTIFGLFALAFAFLEARLLVSLDWTIYDFAFNGFIRYFLRFIIALAALAVCVIQIKNVIKENEKVSKVLYLVDYLLLLISIVITIFATNYVGIICIGLSASIILIKFIRD